MGMFNRNIKIDSGEKYDIKSFSTEELTPEEIKALEKKHKDLIDIYKGNDGNKESFSKLDLAYAMDGFVRGADENNDGILTNKELEKYAQHMNSVLEEEGSNVRVSAKQLRSFIKDVSKLNKNHKSEEMIDCSDMTFEDAKAKIIEENKLSLVNEQDNVYTDKDGRLYSFDKETRQYNRLKHNNENGNFEPMTEEEVEEQETNISFKNVIENDGYSLHNGYSGIVQKGDQLFAPQFNPDTQKFDYIPVKESVNDKGEQIYVADDGDVSDDEVKSDVVETPDGNIEKKNDTPNLDTPTSYTVQLGEDYTDLIKRSLIGVHAGEENYTPSDKEIAEAKALFEKENPGMVKSRNGKKYLLAGASVNIRGGLEDKNNKQEVINQYNLAVSGRKSRGGNGADSTTKPDETGDANKSSGAGDASADEAKYKAEKTEALVKGGYTVVNDNYIMRTENGRNVYYKWSSEQKNYCKEKDLRSIEQDGSKQYDINNRRAVLVKDSKGQETKRYVIGDNWKLSESSVARSCGLQSAGNGYYWTGDKNDNALYFYDHDKKEFVRCSKGIIGSDKKHTKKNGNVMTTAIDSKYKNIDYIQSVNSKDASIASKDLELKLIKWNMYEDKNGKLYAFDSTNGRFYPQTSPNYNRHAAQGYRIR